MVGTQKLLALKFVSKQKVLGIKNCGYLKYCHLKYVGMQTSGYKYGGHQENWVLKVCGYSNLRVLNHICWTLICVQLLVGI